MKSRCLFVAIALASLSPDARSEWASDWVTGCKVDLPTMPAYDDVTWSGPCKDGLATGLGTARGTNATRIEGEFEEGRPIKATGQYVVVSDGGARQLARVSYRKGIAMVEPPSDKPGRKRVAITPLVGSWDLTARDGKCRQRREYLATGESVVHETISNGSQLVQLYSVDGLSGWMEMEATTTSRGIRNCGQESMLRDGDTEWMYLRIDDKGRLSGCTEPDSKTCFLTGVRSGTATDSQSGESGPADSSRQLITSQAGHASGSINTAATPRGINVGGNIGASATNDNARLGFEIVFDRNKGAIYALYGRALRDHPSLAGRVVFELDIDGVGTVTTCRIKSSELNAPGLETRLCARIKLIRFGARTGPVTIVKPIDFFPAA